MDRPALVSELRRKFPSVVWTEVLLDRRRGERRRGQTASDVDRRLMDRRSVPGDHTRTVPFRLAARGDGFAVYEATNLVPARCLDCGLTAVFEMPRFGEPPARLDLHVVHETTQVHHQAKNARHLVDLQSFAASGRLLLASRIVARTRAELP